MIVFNHALLSKDLSRGLKIDQTSEACIGAGFILGFENEGGIFRQSKHFT